MSNIFIIFVCVCVADVCMNSVFLSLSAVSGVLQRRAAHARAYNSLELLMNKTILILFFFCILVEQWRSWTRSGERLLALNAAHYTSLHAMYCSLHTSTPCCPLQNNLNVPYLVIVDYTRVRSANNPRA